MPHQTVASDSMFNGHSWDTPYKEFKGHPRTSGSHGTVFRLGREMGVPLMHTLAQMSYWPAKHLGDAGLEAMQVRGRMQQGMVADITIFDPEKVTDHSTYKTGENGLPTTGIPYVIVNGKMVVKNSEFQKVWAGQPIRYPVESKGRFVPASVERWIETFGIETFSVDDSGTKPHAN
jgi:N-acyl-D-amino-acid deacylase